MLPILSKDENVDRKEPLSVGGDVRSQTIDRPAPGVKGRYVCDIYGTYSSIVAMYSYIYIRTMFDQHYRYLPTYHNGHTGKTHKRSMACSQLPPGVTAVIVPLPLSTYCQLNGKRKGPAIGRIQFQE